MTKVTELGPGENKLGNMDHCLSGNAKTNSNQPTISKNTLPLSEHNHQILKYLTFCQCLPSAAFAVTY